MTCLQAGLYRHCAAVIAHGAWPLLAAMLCISCLLATWRRAAGISRGRAACWRLCWACLLHAGAGGRCLLPRAACYLFLAFCSSALAAIQPRPQHCPPVHAYYSLHSATRSPAFTGRPPRAHLPTRLSRTLSLPPSQQRLTHCCLAAPSLILCNTSSAWRHISCSTAFPACLPSLSWRARIPPRHLRRHTALPTRATHLTASAYALALYRCLHAAYRPIPRLPMPPPAAPHYALPRLLPHNAPSPRASTAKHFRACVR